ncbi:MAG TPA: hypothetical protein VLM37_01615, partial [Fibrobacteraceae bacterium]|nr:hypothetical protein [Fibrobacteraceae bacterium]
YGDVLHSSLLGSSDTLWVNSYRSSAQGTDALGVLLESSLALQALSKSGLARVVYREDQERPGQLFLVSFAWR